MIENTLEKNFAIPPWISCRSYIVNETSGYTIISHQLDHKITLLKDASAVLWSKFEGQCFSRADALAYLGEIGSADPEEDLDSFLTTLTDQQLLVDETTSNCPLPLQPPAPEQSAYSSSIGPVFNEEDKALEDEVANFAEEHGFLFSAFWEVTNRCNEKCIHCFNPGAPHAEHEKGNRSTEELNTQEGLALIQSFYDAGAYRLIVSGGEVFLRRDIFQLLSFARSLHMQIHIFTNGILLNEDRFEQLSKIYPESVSISIYSANAEIHDKITKVPGSFNKSVEALRRLNAFGIKTTIKAIQMAHSVQGYANIEKLAHTLGARHTVELNMSAGNDGAQGPLSLAVRNWSELVTLAVTPGSPIFVGDASNNYSERRRKPGEVFCSAGQSMLSVSSDGKISPCVALPLNVGDVRDHDLSEVWKESVVGLRRSNREAATNNSQLSKWQEIRVADYIECGTHDRCGWCNKCPGMGLNESGDVLAASTTQCRIASARMEGASLLKEGLTAEQIVKKVGLSDNFGFDSSVRPIPEIPVSFIKREEWRVLSTSK